MQIGFGRRLIPLRPSVPSCFAVQRSLFDGAMVLLSRQAATILPHHFLYFLFKILHTELWVDQICCMRQNPNKNNYQLFNVQVYDCIADRGGCLYMPFQ